MPPTQNGLRNGRYAARMALGKVKLKLDRFFDRFAVGLGQRCGESKGGGRCTVSYELEWTLINFMLCRPTFVGSVFTQLFWCPGALMHRNEAKEREYNFVAQESGVQRNDQIERAHRIGSPGWPVRFATVARRNAPIWSTVYTHLPASPDTPG